MGPLGGPPLNFGFTEEQELLRSEVRKFLDQNCPLDEVRKLSETPEGFSRREGEERSPPPWVPVWQAPVRLHGRVVNEELEGRAHVQNPVQSPREREELLDKDIRHHRGAKQD